jgi:cell division septation protein DedD
MKSVQLIAFAAFIATPALADLKTGDIAWQHGDYAAAVGEWRPLAIAGDPDAQLHIGQAYQLGRGVPVDLKLAEDWLRRAAMQGGDEARDSYGLILFQNGKRAEGLPYIEDAAGRGNARAQYILGTALYNGDMTAKDYPRAYAMMIRALAAGMPAAKNSLAEMDKYIPLEQRNRGKALAQAFEAHANAQTASMGKAVQPHVEAGPVVPEPKIGAPRVVEPQAPKPPKSVKVAVTKPVTAIKAPVAKPAPAPGGKWRIQLGAFSDGSKANSLWSGLRSKIAALGPYQSYVVKAGAVTRLQAGPIASRAAADSLCAAVRAAKQPCLPVAP